MSLCIFINRFRAWPRESNGEEQCWGKGVTARFKKKKQIVKYLFVLKKIIPSKFPLRKNDYYQKTYRPPFQFKPDQKIDKTERQYCHFKGSLDSKHQCLCFFSIVYECVSLLPACRPRFNVNFVFTYCIGLGHLRDQVLMNIQSVSIY